MLSEYSVRAMAETALWLLPEGLACELGAKANVPFAGRHKIELKKMCGGENKKYRRVGNECRLTRCPLKMDDRKLLFQHEAILNQKRRSCQAIFRIPPAKAKTNTGNTKRIGENGKNGIKR